MIHSILGYKDLISSQCQVQATFRAFEIEKEKLATLYIDEAKTLKYLVSGSSDAVIYNYPSNPQTKIAQQNV